MAFEFKLPDIGEGLTEGEVTKWLVKEGQTVTADQPMVEVLTDKATVEITAPRAGVIAKILVPDGTKVPVGTVIVLIETGGAAPAVSMGPRLRPRRLGTRHPRRRLRRPPGRPRRPRPRRPGRRRPPRDGHRPRTGRAGGACDARAGPGARARPARRPGHGPQRPHHEDRPRVVRGERRGTRRGGSGDAAAPAAGAAPAARAPIAPPTVAVSSPAVSAEDVHVPLKGLRGKIAEQMLRSKQHSPHFTFVDECDVTELVALREQAKTLASERGVKLTYLPFVMKALVAGFRRFPTLNSVVDDVKGEFVIRKEFNIGIATDTDDGLTVPVVKHVDRLTILQIGAELQRLTEAARGKKIALGDLKGGTFTITSAGSIGGILATPILNYPEVGILGIYKIADRPMVRGGQIVVRKMMNLSITLDHRIVDGATAAHFLNTVIQYLETPNLLLLEGI